MSVCVWIGTDGAGEGEDEKVGILCRGSVECQKLEQPCVGRPQGNRKPVEARVR